jgi:hypothetical protein
MNKKGLTRALFLALALVLSFALFGCGSDEADSSSSWGESSQSSDTSGTVADAGSQAAPADFDDIPDLSDYEMVDETEMGTELYVTFEGDADPEQALADFGAWAEANGWTALDVDWPNTDLAFEKADRVYPLKISAYPRSGGSEILLIMPAEGEKLGDW